MNDYAARRLAEYRADLATIGPNALAVVTLLDRIGRLGPVRLGRLRDAMNDDWLARSSGAADRGWQSAMAQGMGRPRCYGWYRARHGAELAATIAAERAGVSDTPTAYHLGYVAAAVANRDIIGEDDHAILTEPWRVAVGRVPGRNPAGNPGRNP